MRHLLTLNDWSPAEIAAVIKLAAAIKKSPADYHDAMYRKVLMMIFEKPSLRTRVSFETGMSQMGGHAIFYDLSASPLGAGKENIHDTMKTVSRYADLVMARLFDHEKIEEMARYAGIPVINGLTDFAHPCQILGDLLTIQEHKGELKGRTVVYLGDAHNNVTHSLMIGCSKLGLNIRVGCPEGADYSPMSSVVAAANANAAQTGAQVLLTHDALEAVEGADVVYTDSWMSYHIPPDRLEARVKVFTPYQVNAEKMTRAAKDAIFMNCLPALRGYEQSADVMDGPQSVVFDQAENRLHIQKAVMIRLVEEVRKG